MSSDIKGGINYGIDTCWFNPNMMMNESDIIPKYEITKLEDVVAIVMEEAQTAYDPA